MDESSLPGVLQERARTQPDEPAFTYVDYELDPAGVAETLTWARLYRQTSNVARELKACGSTGDRAVILAPQGTEYFLAFLGALQAGQIAVPLPLPMPGSGDERVSSVLLDASPATILTTSAVAGDIAQYIRPKPGGDAITVVEVDLLALDDETGAAADVDSLPSTAHLQYTSGSTRTPAGVMVSHKNIQVNCAQLRSAYYQDGIAPADTTVVSWLPFFHDMGLILNIAFPIFGGFHSVLTSPPAFLQRPARWMQLLASNSHAFSAAPNIAFELAAAKTSDKDLAGLDLGGVRTILNGAERVNPPSLRRFAERFAPFNLRPEALRPSYGLAEATLYVATRETGQPPETVYFDSEKLTAGEAQRCSSGEGTPLVSYGMHGSPMVRIVDPEARVECSEGTVGEIWVHGDNVCEGYWQKPEETERTFGAELVDPSDGAPESPWLRTGDLGFVSDGEMFIVGRIKDLLIVYGRNYAPDDIEATIQEITAGRVVAGAVPGEDGVEKLVTIVEFKSGGDSEEAAQRVTDVKRKITAAVSRTHELGIADLVMVPPHSIPLTTSGKVRRRDSLKLYLGGEFSRLNEVIPRPKRQTSDGADAPTAPDPGWSQRLATLRQQQHDVLVGLVRSQVATVLGTLSPDDFDPEIPFRDMGFDSVKATELIDRLKNVTALALPPTLAFDHPTPNALATHLGHLLGGSVPSAAPAAAQVESTEPIAVVGMACRFPGGVESTTALWDVVATGREALSEFPTDRGWNLADLFDPDPDAAGKTYTRVGGFLAEAAGFDAEFFAISDREAQTMDPQQRLLLEVCWEALETARIDPAGLAGSRTGVFVGAWSQTYGAGGSDGAEGYALTGGSPSVVSGRISYTLGLQGPAITIDTACSSSLVASHLACQSLRSGESSLALAGGVTVMTTPSVFTEFARQRGLAADGRCKAFSADADGTGWGEGAAMVVLERLSDARRNNHPVLALIAGSAVNSDGASNGLTAPNGPAQQRVITEAAANAGVGLDQVDVVEAHGTGTTLGDPIEAGALLATYGAAREDSHPLWLGSIKSNIGHTQAAAGVAGIIKMVEALNRDSLPPTLHVDRPSPHIDWSTRTVQILTEPVPWPATDHPRTAAVSSFGISGTNAHLILQQAPAADPVDRTATARDDFQVRMWPVSGRTPAALCAQADRLHHFLAGNPDLDLTDAAYSLGATRAHHPYRAVIAAPADSGTERDDLLGALDALRRDESHPHLIRHHFLARLRGKTVFVLPGQGAQYAGMGRELYEHHRVFAETVDACDEALRPLTGWSVREVLRQEPSAPSLDRVDVVQPVLFTMMVSLAEVLASYGIVPDAVIGHSQGEIAAAYIAGALSLPEAAAVVARRSQALSALRGTGGMASVLLAAERVEPLLQPWGDALSIAAVNGPSHTIVSGDPAALEEFSAACDRDGIHFRRIAVDYASHSAQVESARARLLDELADLKPTASAIPLYSTVGEALDTDPLDTTTMTAEYWYRNLREPVRFHDRVLQRLAAGQTTFVELSPHPVLAPAITDTVAQSTGSTQSTGSAQSAVVITLHRDRPDRDSLATALAQLHAHGHSPTWAALYPGARSVELPTYAFQHRRYWMTPTPTASVVSSPAEGALWKALRRRRVSRPDITESSSGTAIASASALRETLADQTSEQQRHTLAALVAGATATVLAHPDPDALHNDVAFKDLGMDSLTAVELRNSLGTQTGLSLPATLIFDHPTTTALVTHLADLLTETSTAAAAATGTTSATARDNRLALTDQASYHAERAVHSALIQFTWLYNRGVDVDGLRRFHRNLGLGLLGRKIERSPIPFARHRWVASPASEDIDFAATPRRRSDISDWADERARVPIDAERGPGWHLGVLPLEDGGAAVTLVVSHNIADGRAVLRVITDAVEGRTPELGYPPARSRTRSHAFREDLRHTVTELPDVAKAVVAVVRRARQGDEFASSTKGATPAPKTAGGGHAVDVPVLTAFVDLADWDARAKDLGGSSNSLVAGFACRLAARVGHVFDDGTVNLRLPVTLRTADDNSGNSLTAVDVRIDPNLSVTELGELHAKITKATLEAMESSDEFLAPLPLVPLTPKWVIRKLAGALAGGAGLVTCSNVGDLPPAVNRPDGSDADYAYMTPVEPDITKRILELLGGRLLVGSGRLQGKIVITISAYLLGGPNTKAELREVISETFAEFDLIAEMGD
ncbi:fatty-acid--AMP ligase [Mycobacterium sp. RTGN5]|uniref:fatty-acid--AMP ligase n=1 Tax=Mycobacterium sp. RTGN5 TaxID=3016522 RepID=UPI0029C89FD6|nr:fatty-acid--AMP ligase [Mycobacterium sp. RTGN5]